MADLKAFAEQLVNLTVKEVLLHLHLKRQKHEKMHCFMQFSEKILKFF